MASKVTWMDNYRQQTSSIYFFSHYFILLGVGTQVAARPENYLCCFLEHCTWLMGKDTQNICIYYFFRAWNHDEHCGSSTHSDYELHP